LDEGYDAHKLAGNNSVRFASLIKDDEFVIQSLAPISLADTKVVPLLVFSQEDGNHSFTEYRRENIPANLAIFLHDKVLGTYHDLATGNYIVNLNKNIEYKTRFELIFKYKAQTNGGSSNGNLGLGSGSTSNGQTTSVTNVEANQFTVSQNENEILLQNDNGIIGNIKLIDVTGRIVWSKNQVNANKISIPWNSQSTGVYFISVENNNNRLFFQQIVQ
jgi:hypothetical protein